MNKITFVGQQTPEKNLKKEILYRYYPDQEMQDKILTDLKKSILEDLNDCLFSIKIEITLKEYDT